MAMLEELLKSGMADGVLKQMGARSGLNATDLNSVISKIAPVLMGRARENFAGNADSSGLIDLIKGSNLDNINAQVDTDNGNAILGELLGSKDASRALAGEVGKNLGISVDKIKSLLPMIAPLVTGALNKQAGGAQAFAGSDISKMTDNLTSMLDSDGDGQISANEIMGFLGKFFGKK